MNEEKIKLDFPMLKLHPSLVYLDSTATSLKPESVIQKEDEYYREYGANVFRGVYKASEKATEEYEGAREVVASFIGGSASQVIFTRNTSESINLVAYSLGRKIINQGDEIVVSIAEHHSNFVPWQQLCLENGGKFVVVEVDEEGVLNVDFESLVSKRTKIVALTYVSNVLGSINPIRDITRSIKKTNPSTIVIVDAAQAVPHLKVNVSELGCDFLAFSSHKMLGPTGVGVLWGKDKYLESMYPFLFGGEMISEVYVDRTLFKPPPHKFEAGTPHIAGVIALGEAVRYLQGVGMEKVREHEIKLTRYGLTRLSETFGKRIRILGPKDVSRRGGAISFVFDRYHPHDIAQILDESDIAVRAGNHCAMPLHTFYKVSATTRASFYIYNSLKDIDKLVDGLIKVKEILG